METFVELMNRGSFLGALAGLAMAACMLPLVVLIHEAGHALAALALGRRIGQFVVGDSEPVLTVRNDRFRFSLGAITGRGGPAGYVLFDAGRAEPRHVFLIALAGPVASFAGAVIAGVLSFWASPQPAIWFALMMLMVAGLQVGVANLRVSGDGPDSWSDGVWVRAAWRAMRRPAGWSDPNEATSVAPPG